IAESIPSFIHVLRIYIFLLFTLALLVSYTSHAQHAVTVRIENLNLKKGDIYIAWYNNPAGFGKPEHNYLSKVEGVEGVQSWEYTFKNIPEGQYAIAVFFDTDGNGKLSTNFMGVPSEKYAFSNNAFKRTRMVRFEEAAFEVKSATKQVLRLR